MDVRRVLVIDDNKGDAELLRARLMDAPFEGDLEHASTLAAGLEVLAQRNFDVVALDLDLGPTSGLETLEAFRAARDDVPVLVFTGRDDAETALGALRLGADDYIVKNEATGPLVYRALRYAKNRRSRVPGARGIQLVETDGWGAPDVVDKLIAEGLNVVWLGWKRNFEEALHTRQHIYYVDASHARMAPADRPGVALASPTSLDRIAMLALRGTKHVGTPCALVVDALEDLRYHAGEQAMVELVHYLANQARSTGLEARFLMDRDADRIRDRVVGFMDVTS